MSNNNEKYGLKREAVLDLRHTFAQEKPLWEVCSQSSSSGYVTVYVCASDIKEALALSEKHAVETGYGFVAMSASQVDPGP